MCRISILHILSYEYTKFFIYQKLQVGILIYVDAPVTRLFQITLLFQEPQRCKNLKTYALQLDCKIRFIGQTGHVSGCHPLETTPASGALPQRINLQASIQGDRWLLALGTSFKLRGRQRSLTGRLRYEEWRAACPSKQF